MDRIDAMRAFVAVADARGFAAAARKLGLSPSAATRLVAALEERLGLRLFQRTTRSVTLTDGGARYLERARRILADLDEAEDVANAERTIPTGRFVVAAPNLFGRLHVAPLLSAYLVRFPAVAGTLLLADRVINLVDEGVDVAVRIGHLPDSSLYARPLGHTRRVVVGAPSYWKRHKRPRAPADLMAHALIAVTSLAPADEWRFVHDGRDLTQPIAPQLTTNSADAAIDHARRGGGVAMVLAYQVAELVRAGELQIVLPAFEPPPLPIQLVYTTNRHLSAKVKAFADLAATRDWSFVKV
ncbi:MAG TPA: LysR family transcriptional regulator [Polyangia bacterium]|nr:LysR family transcriptional regulator [Polyangia bacterium]